MGVVLDVYNYPPTYEGTTCYLLVCYTGFVSACDLCIVAIVAERTKKGGICGRDLAKMGQSFEST